MTGYSCHTLPRPVRLWRTKEKTIYRYVEQDRTSNCNGQILNQILWLERLYSAVKKSAVNMSNCRVSRWRGQQYNHRANDVVCQICVRRPEERRGEIDVTPYTAKHTPEDSNLQPSDS